MKRILLLAVAVMVTACGDAGLGLEEAVYVIVPRGTPLENAEDLAKIGVDEDYPPSGTYYLAADIDLSELSEEPWTPIGTAEEPFSGVLNGMGKTIHVYSLGEGGTAVYSGLFGYLQKARLSNLTIEYGGAPLALTATAAQYAGIAAGYIKSSNINNVTVRGAGDIQIDKANAGNFWTGGLAGRIENSTISKVTVDINLDTTYTPTAATTNLYIGTLAGEVSGGTLTGSQAEGSIEANAPQGRIYAGGLVGSTSALLADCSSAVTRVYAEVNGAGGTIMNVGGIAGSIGGGTITSSSLKSDSPVVIKALYKGTGTTSHTATAGGISGTTNGTTTKCVVDADVQISAETTTTSATLYAGGIVGLSASVQNSSVKRGTVRAISTATGTASNKNICAGGISGYINAGSAYIQDCFSRADVTAETAFNVATQTSFVTAAGGILGGYSSLGVRIEKSGASGTVTVKSTNASSNGTVFAGGLWGFGRDYENLPMSIINSAALNTQIRAEAAGTAVSANRVLGGVLTNTTPTLVTDISGITHIVLQTNYAHPDMSVQTKTSSGESNVEQVNNVSGLAGDSNGFEATKAFFAGTLGWDFTKNWDWDTTADLPIPRL